MMQFEERRSAEILRSKVGKFKNLATLLNAIQGIEVETLRPKIRKFKDRHDSLSKSIN